jgi:hypothetical protein
LGRPTPNRQDAIEKEQRVFELFRIWLIVVALGMAVAGTLMALLGGTRLFAGVDRLIDPAFWKKAPDAAVHNYKAWIYGVLGGTMAGWGLTVAILVAGAFSTRQAWAWWSVAAGVGLWFVLDTAQSLRYRVYANAFVNTALLVTLAIPLAFTFADFH